MIHLSHTTNRILSRDTKDRYVGLLHDLIILESKEDVELLCGISPNVIICNFEKDIEFEREILNKFIYNGIEKIGTIKYLKQ